MYRSLISSQEKECLQDLVGLSVPGPQHVPHQHWKDKDPGWASNLPTCGPTRAHLTKEITARSESACIMCIFTELESSNITNLVFNFRFAPLFMVTHGAESNLLQTATRSILDLYQKRSRHPHVPLLKQPSALLLLLP